MIHTLPPRLLHLHGHQRSALHLTNVAVAADGPHVGNLFLINRIPQQAAGGPVLHQRAGLGPRHATKAQDGHVLEGLVDACVVVAAVRVPGGRLLATLDGLALGDGELDAEGLGAVALGLGGDEGATGGEAVEAVAVGQAVDEPADEGQVVRVDQLKGRGAVVARAHDVGEAIERDHDGAAILGGSLQLGPKSLQHGPSGFGLLARVDKIQEGRGVCNNFQGEVLVLVQHSHRLQDVAASLAHLL